MGGKLWIVWNPEVVVSVENRSGQHVTILVQMQSHHMFVTFVYAKCSYQERCELWARLEGSIPLDSSWMIVGDFNIISNDSERRGGRRRPLVAMEEFNEFINGNGLSNLPHSCNSLSWCNGHDRWTRSWARLDRSLVNGSFLENPGGAHMKYLSRSTSNHSPMIIWLESPLKPYGSVGFKFQQMWVMHERFMDRVLFVWIEEEHGSGLYRLASKLKILIIILRRWNKETFGSTTENILALEERIERLELSLQQCYSQADEQDLLISQLECLTWKKREEIRLAHQAKITWLEKGEGHAKFLKSFQLRNLKVVREMKPGDEITLNSLEDVHNGVVEYFQDFLMERAS